MYRRGEGRSMCIYGLGNRLLQVISAYLDGLLVSSRSSMYGASATHQMMQLMVLTQMASRFEANTLLIL